MKEYAAEFYKSAAWKECRAQYVKKAHGLCEICLARGLYVPGQIVHHKTHITPANINDPNITLSFENLQLVCRECHAELHKDRSVRYRLNEWGKVTAL